MAIKSLSDIQSDLARRSAAVQRPAAPAVRSPVTQPGGSLAFGADDWRQTAAARRSAMDADNAYTQQMADISGQDPTRSPTAAFDRIVGIGEAGYDSAVNNQVDQMLLEQLQGRITGTDQPYNDTTINAFKTGAADQGAAAEMANNMQAMQQLESRGFSPSDPSYQAALRQNQQQRQKGNQAANLSIAQQANTANYGAKTDAMSQANMVNRGKQAAELAAGSALKKDYNQVSSLDRWKAPTWSDYSAKMSQKTNATPGPRPQR